MFSPGTKKSNLSSRKERKTARVHPPPVGHGSPVTPVNDNRKPVSENPIPDRPSTGTPAPWASRLSVLARIPTAKKSDKVDDVDPIQPVYVGEVPQVVRDEQANLLQKHVSGETGVSGGMDKGTCLAWIISGSRLFIWSYLSPAASRKCTVLELPSSTLEDGDINKNSGSTWLFCVLDWDHFTPATKNVLQQRTSLGVLLCNRKTRALVYWPNIYSSSVAVTYIDQSESITTINKQQQRSSYNSLIASGIPDGHYFCVALGCSSNGQLFNFICSPTGIRCQEIITVFSQGSQVPGPKGYPRSLIWDAPYHTVKALKRKFLVLTDHEIQCFSVDLLPDYRVSKIWSHEIVGNDVDVGIQKGLAGQKKIWPLDMQIDSNGKVITILVATFCKDRATSSSYIEYSLLTMQYKSGFDTSSDITYHSHDKILEKKSPIEVIIPKARVEDEDFLFSMRLKVGGKPSGSSIILSGDGTATVTRYWRNTSRLYKFDLPYDAGKVVDASVFPCEDGEDGAWAVLTEKAGVWAIPEKAVLLGGVEPPERSLSRKGSSKEGSTQEEKRNVSFAGNIAPRRASSEAWDAGDRQRAVFTGIAHPTAQDEESEALLAQFFHEFLQSGAVIGTLNKLQNSGTFERDGETNVFARVSKSIVDTLAKHWTTTRGAEILALAVVSTQLLDKQQKHQKFLQFLALSKCHEELSSRQRQSLQIIMEHGEKLASMIQLRELQNLIRQQSSTEVVFTNSGLQNELSGSIWDVIQLVGEKARQNTVLLMDRDNAEVFYSKVSELEEVFHCLERKLSLVISEEMPFTFQLQRACELSSMCVTLINTAMNYKDENHMWYPSPEGLTPWYCQNGVRSGMWTLASFMLHLLNEMGYLDRSAKLEFYSHLEVLVKVLLESYSGAITAKVEREEEHGGLLDEYWNRRDILLDSLYQQVNGFNQDSSEVVEDQNKEISQKLSSNLLAIAKRHEGYQTLWNLSFSHGDLELLKSLMHNSMGPRGGFSNFVFKQMYNNKEFSKIIRLGEEFPEELAIFLKEHPDLLWLHEICLRQFSSASETLHLLAVSDGDSSISEAEAPTSYEAKMEPTLADRRRLLNLSKIAALAGKHGDYDTKLKRIEADLRILKLQEEIMNLVPDDEETQEIAQKLLPPAELIQLCLRYENKQLALYAFDVFAWTSLSFLRGNISLLEECWKNAANQDDWETINQTSAAKGLSDEEMLEVLRETALFQASRRCYGPEAEAYEGGFEQVLPLRQDSLETSMGSSVEGILMQHRSFPDADRLMVTAIVLGSISFDTTMEDGPSPME